MPLIFWITLVQTLTAFAAQPYCLKKAYYQPPPPPSAVTRTFSVSAELEAEQVYLVTMRRDQRQQPIKFSQAMTKLFNDPKMGQYRKRYFQALEMGYQTSANANGVKTLKQGHGFVEVRVLGKDADHRLLGCVKNGTIHFFAWERHDRMDHALAHYQCL